MERVKDLREDNIERLFAMLSIPSSSIELFDKNNLRVSSEENLEMAVPILHTSWLPIFHPESLRERYRRSFRFCIPFEMYYDPISVISHLEI